MRLQIWKQILKQCKLFNFNLLSLWPCVKSSPTPHIHVLCVLLLFLTLSMYEGRISTPAFHYYLLRETKDQTKSKSFLKNLKAKSLLIFTSNPKQFDVSRLSFCWSTWRYHHFHFSYKIYAVSETLSTLTQPSNTSLNMLFQTCFSPLETIPQLLQFELQFCKIRPSALKATVRTTHLQSAQHN